MNFQSIKLKLPLRFFQILNFIYFASGTVSIYGQSRPVPREGPPVVGGGPDWAWWQWLIMIALVFIIPFVIVYSFVFVSAVLIRLLEFLFDRLKSLFSRQR